MNNNINLLYHQRNSKTLSSLLNNAANSICKTCDNSQYKLKEITNTNNNVSTCSCMLHLILLQVTIYN